MSTLCSAQFVSVSFDCVSRKKKKKKPYYSRLCLGNRNVPNDLCEARIFKRTRARNNRLKIVQIFLTIIFSSLLIKTFKAFEMNSFSLKILRVIFSIFSFLARKLTLLCILITYIIFVLGIRNCLIYMSVCNIVFIFRFFILK